MIHEETSFFLFVRVQCLNYQSEEKSGSYIRLNGKMWFSTSLVLVLLVLLWKLMTPRKKLNHIPGPTLWSLLSRKQDPTKFHLMLTEFGKTYGPVVKVPRLGMEPLVCLNDFYSIYEVYVKLGKEAAGRNSSLYRFQKSFDNTGIVFNLHPDKTWKSLRKSAQGHMKQFGEGLTRLELGINMIAKNMLDDFLQSEGTPFDPSDTVFNTALQTIVYLLIGSQLEREHPLVKKMKTLVARFLHLTSLTAPFHIQVIDFVPFLRNSWWPGYRLLVQHKQMVDEVYEMVKHMSTTTDSESLTEVLQSQVLSGNISEVDAKQSAAKLLFAAVITTSTTFYGAINLLAHNPDVQERILKEVDEVAGQEVVQLKDRSNLPYTQATILEINRITSVVPFGAGREACSDIIVKGVHIAKGTNMLINQWSLHHDPVFWGDPEVFRPERFLENDRKLVTADDPKRKHLMPFGAGTRVCLGEAFAMARLFLWLATVVQQFEIIPAEANSKWKTLPENYLFETTVSSPEYKVIFKPR